MPAQEQVLVVERSVFDALGAFQGLRLEAQRLLDELLAPGVPRFVPRSQAEHDRGLKQLIPYVIIGAGGKYLTYVRGKRAGETRLVGLRSIGIGGHINPVDDMPLFNADFHDAYRTAVAREVAEEIDVQAEHVDRVVALLNDDSTDVGRVHLGVVHHWSLSSPSVQKREQMITQMDFLTPAELRNVRDEMETWSQLCLDRLEELTGSAARTGSADISTPRR